MSAQQFRTRPVVVEATQWFKNGDHPEDYAKVREGYEGARWTSFSGAHAKANDWEGDVVRRFRRPGVSGFFECRLCSHVMDQHGWLDCRDLPGGGPIVCPGDWVITEVSGERHVCKPDIFEKTYEPAVSTAADRLSLVLEEVGRQARRGGAPSPDNPRMMRFVVGAANGALTPDLTKWTEHSLDAIRELAATCVAWLATWKTP